MLGAISLKDSLRAIEVDIAVAPNGLRRSFPQLNALRSFEAAARHQSFTRAADELCVTQGAVSHQVKALETALGLKLFNRERQGLVITNAGHDYLAVVRDAFDRIALGTDRLRPAPQSFRARCLRHHGRRRRDLG